jgi:hypothetical protein
VKSSVHLCTLYQPYRTRTQSDMRLGCALPS